MGRKSYYDKNLGENIYNKKYNKNLTLREIAEDLELAISTVYNYLNNYESEIDNQDKYNESDFELEYESDFESDIYKPNYEINNLKLNYELLKNEKISIYPVSDWHIGSANCNYDFIEYMVNIIEEDNNEKIIIGLGDYLESASKHVGNSAFTQEMSLDEQVNTFIDYMKPFKKDLVGLCEGNHCARLTKEFDLNIMNIIGKQLNTKTGGSILQRIFINDKPYQIFGTHGKGSASRDELALGKIKREYNHIEANLVLIGHMHRLKYIDELREGIMGNYRKYSCLCGSMLSYKGSYGESMGLPRLNEGFMKIEVNDKLVTKPIMFNIDEVSPHLLK